MANFFIGQAVAKSGQEFVFSTSFIVNYNDSAVMNAKVLEFIHLGLGDNNEHVFTMLKDGAEKAPAYCFMEDKIFQSLEESNFLFDGSMYVRPKPRIVPFEERFGVPDW